MKKLLNKWFSTRAKKRELRDRADAKAVATKAGDPWVSVISVDIDPENPESGAFELDWNDIFLAKLVRAGYPGKNDHEIVDNWFRTVCRHIVLENYEQDQADPNKRAASRTELGDGRSAMS